MPSDRDDAVTCTLPSNELAERLVWIGRVAAHGLVTHRQDGGTLRLSFKQSALPDLERLVQQEGQCCPHLTFVLIRAAGIASLVITAPDAHESEMRWLFDQFVPGQTQASAKACGCAPGACG